MSASGLSGGTTPAFTFSESKVAKESFQGLKDGAHLKAPAGLPNFGFKAQSDFSFRWVLGGFAPSQLFLTGPPS